MNSATAPNALFFDKIPKEKVEWTFQTETVSTLSQQGPSKKSTPKSSSSLLGKQKERDR